MARSRYTAGPFDLGRVRTYPLASRPSKVGVGAFGRPHQPGASLANFLDGLPRILAAESLRDLARAAVQARAAAKPVLWGIGAHVVKTGLAPVIVDLMDRGFVSGLALNGAAAIHDFEIALAGSTSEDVPSQLDEGAFGMAEETGAGIAQAVADGAADGLGMGEAIGRQLERAAPPFGSGSLLLQAYARSVPVTVHVTIGADIVHNHPRISAAALGETSHRDFRLFASLVAGLHAGGVYINCGSAVVLPEVFLKCLSLVRNSGAPLQDFTTANLDFVQHYRPTENVVRRPVRKGGRGIAITGHHEIMIPLLAAWIVEMAAGS